MSARVHSLSLLALTLAVGTLPAATARAQQPAIVWGPTVQVLGLPAATLRAMNGAPDVDPRWPTILAVRVVATDGTSPLDRPAILGKYRVEAGNSLRFTPQFPLDATRRYRATLDPDGWLGDAPVLVADRAATPRPPTPATVVARVEPLGDRLPENLLKFYVYFSAPMGRGEAYNHLSLVDDRGQKLDHPFLELGEELWDPTGTRLTVLLDPGRIKRGLRPREELGPIFVADRSYTLRIDPSWRDALGRPLGGPAARTLATAAADETSPDPKAWTITAPRAGSSDPILIGFGDTLDRATVASGLTLLDPRGLEVPGTAEAAPEGTGWRFAPAGPWFAGTYSLSINPDLEDLAGNSIRRPFEVDVQRDVPVTPEASAIRLPIIIAR